MFQKGLISVITATYNRADKLHRVFNSLQSQTYKNFEWIIIDDGSKDNTKQLVEKWKMQVDYIRYYYQENAGKHVAVNRALDLVQGEYMTGIDSDDEVRPDAFEVLIQEWEKIPEDQRTRYKNVTAKCYNPETGLSIGAPINEPYLDCSSLDARYIHKMNYERWGLSRTEVAIQFRAKEIDGRFYPEAIMQDECAKYYIERYINTPLRGYYQDADNSILRNRINKENYALWVHNINDNMTYFKYSPMSFIKSFVGVSMTGFAKEMKISQMLMPVNAVWKKAFVFFLIPCGFVMYKIKK